MPRWAVTGLHRIWEMGLLTTAEVAERLRWHVDTVTASIRSGELPAINVGRGAVARWRVDEAELDRFIAKRSSTPPPEVEQ